MNALPSSRTLSGRSVVVLGGSSGIGLGIALAAARAGAEVTIVGRSAERLAAATRAPNEDMAPLRTVSADATDEDAVGRVFAAVGEVDHVVLTAVDACYARVRELDVSRARRAFDSKVIAALLAAKHARFRGASGAPGAAPGPSLLLTSGIAMDRPAPASAVVAAMNGAVTAMIRALALDLAPVRVNAISPGWVDTPVWDLLAGADKGARLAAQAARLPVGRIGAPSDIARAALFLMESGFTTGETLHVDGGHRLV